MSATLAAAVRNVRRRRPGRVLDLALGAGVGVGAMDERMSSGTFAAATRLSRDIAFP